MKQNSNRIQSAAALGTLVLAGMFMTSCAMPPQQFFRRVKEEGLMSTLGKIRSERKADGPQMVEKRQEAYVASPIITPKVVKVPFGEAVPGRTGYVYSPHTSPRKLVDVRDFKPGEEVRCPITMKPFLVPDFEAIASSRAQDSSESGSVDVATSGPLEITEVQPTVQPRSRVEDKPDAPEPAADIAVDELPFGNRVPNQPGVVYSPYAGEGQLVDVAGIAPGATVRCPWTQRLFRVPDLTPEELGQPKEQPAPTPAAPSTKVEDKPKEEPAPAPAPAPQPKTEDKPSDPAAAPTTAPADIPTAEWADKEKFQVKSPYGAAGLINVKNMKPGTVAQDPFTGKPFVVPNP